MGCPRSQLKGSDLDQFLGVKMEKDGFFWVCQCIISSMHGWRKMVCYLIILCPLMWPRSLSKGSEWLWQIIFGENGENLRKVSMESQGHINYHWSHFFGVNLPCQGVLCSVNGIFKVKGYMFKVNGYGIGGGG